MADVVYTSTNPAGVPNNTKQVTDEHVTRGHMPVVKLAYSAAGSDTQVQADDQGLLVQISNTGANPVPIVTAGTLSITGSVDVASSVLPNGAATEATLTNVKNVLDSVASGTATIGTNTAALLTDTQLRASPIPVSGPLTDVQLRASAVPVTANAGTNLNTSLLALEAGGNLASVKTNTDKIPSLGQALAAASVPVVLTAAQLSTLTPPAALSNYALETGGNLASIKADVDKIPSQGQALASASMPVVLTAAQITTLTPPAAITGFALETTQSAQSTLIGAVTESAPASDTASSGLNGRLQRVAQRLTSLIALVPASLGQKAMAASLAVVVASDQSAIPVSGTVTITPSGTQTVTGNKTNNNAAPGATNVGALVGVANAAAPTQVEGNLVALRTTLSGDLAITLDSEAVVLGAGAAVIGKVSIDQTTPGTTNLVALAANQSVNMAQIAGTAVDTNSGVKSAGTQRVVIATDQPNLTTPLNVNNAQVNGVALTTDNGVSGTGVQRVTLASNSTGNIATIGTSVVPGTGATHLGKAEDTAHTTGDTGVELLVVRRDANTSLVDTDGDYAPLQVDATGSLKVAIISGAGSGGTASTDGATYTASTTSGTPMMGARDDTSPGVVAEDKLGIVRISTRREMFSQIRDAAGNERGLNVDANGEIGIGAIRTSITPGTAAANLGKAEDAAHTTGDTGVLGLAVRRDANTSLVDTDGDYAPLQVEATGPVKTSLYGKSSAGGDTPVKVDAGGYIQNSTPFELSLTVTRPNDTTTYASGDSIADSTSAPTAFTIAGFSRNNGGGGAIQHVIVTVSTAPALKAQLELWVFRSSYTNNNDNAAIALSDADNDKVIAVIPLGGTPAVGGANVMYEAEVFKNFVTGGASTSLWFAIVVRNAYIPTALETFKVVFQGYQTN